MSTNSEILGLLSEALDLCVRARDMEARERRGAALGASSAPDEWQASGSFDRHVTRNNIQHPDFPIHHSSATVPLWLEHQYQRDVSDWERRARSALMKEPTP